MPEEEHTKLSLYLLGDADSLDSVKYSVDIDQCQDGTPWTGFVAKFTKSGANNWRPEASDMAELEVDVATMCEMERPDAADWVLGKICARLGIEDHVYCLVCVEATKKASTLRCPYSDRMLCPSCHTRIEESTPVVSQSIIRDALNKENPNDTDTES